MLLYWNLDPVDGFPIWGDGNFPNEASAKRIKSPTTNSSVISTTEYLHERRWHEAQDQGAKAESIR